MERIHDVINIKQLMSDQLAKHVITEMVELDVSGVPIKPRDEDSAVLPR